MFLLAIPIGGLIGYKFDKRKTVEKDKKQELNNSFFKTYIIPFLGGFILLYGARMADGCTSGHMMSGMMQSSVSGYIFAIFTFIIAIPTAMLLHKKS